MQDRWKSLRSELCFGNVEPEVDLVAITQPQGILKNWYTEDLPALLAPVSYGSEIDNYEKAENLNRKLIKMGHHVPLEFCAFQFRLTGISKSCSSQIARHWMSSQVSSLRRYRTQDTKFVYPMLSNETDEEFVRTLYGLLSTHNELAMAIYQTLRHAGVPKQDARRVIPVCSAVEKYLCINARSLRNFFHLRLASNAEWEIRRLAEIILGIVTGVTPSLFEDIYHEEVSK